MGSFSHHSVHKCYPTRSEGLEGKVIAIWQLSDRAKARIGSSYVESKGCVNGSAAANQNSMGEGKKRKKKNRVASLLHPSYLVPATPVTVSSREA